MLSGDNHVLCLEPMFLLLPSILTFTPFFDPYKLESLSNITPTETKNFIPQTPPQKSDSIRIAKLADLIGSVESDTVGGYNAANAGSAMDLGINGLTKITGKSCEELTIKEVMALQRRQLLYAVGRYQMIPTTLRAAVKWAKFSENDYFTPANQDKLLLALIQHKRPKVWHYIQTGENLEGAVNALAKEWAGIPTTSGHSYYGYGNRAHTSVQKVLIVLQQVRSKFAIA